MEVQFWQYDNDCGVTVLFLQAVLYLWQETKHEFSFCHGVHLGVEFCRTFTMMRIFLRQLTFFPPDYFSNAVFVVVALQRGKTLLRGRPFIMSQP